MYRGFCAKLFQRFKPAARCGRSTSIYTDACSQIKQMSSFFPIIVKIYVLHYMVTCSTARSLKHGIECYHSDLSNI